MHPSVTLSPKPPPPQPPSACRLPDITPAPPSSSFLPQDTTPRAFATEFNHFLQVPPGLPTTLSNNPVNAPRARLGPTKVSNHVGHHMHQRHGHFPDLRTLLAASAMRSLIQTASRTLLYGLVTPLYNINFTITPSLLWRHRWNAFLRFRLTPNPLTPLRRQSRIFGQSRLCP